MTKNSLSLGNPEITHLSETGMDDHIAMTVEESAGLVKHMQENDVKYWGRLIADRKLYQIFVNDPNGVILELNDDTPDLENIDSMTIVET